MPGNTSNIFDEFRYKSMNIHFCILSGIATVGGSSLQRLQDPYDQIWCNARSRSRHDMEMLSILLDFIAK